MESLCAGDWCAHLWNANSCTPGCERWRKGQTAEVWFLHTCIRNYFLGRVYQVFCLPELASGIGRVGDGQGWQNSSSKKSPLLCCLICPCLSAVLLPQESRMTVRICRKRLDLAWALIAGVHWPDLLRCRGRGFLSPSWLISQVSLAM